MITRFVYLHWWSHYIWAYFCFPKYITHIPNISSGGYKENKSRVWTFLRFKKTKKKSLYTSAPPKPSDWSFHYWCNSGWFRRGISLWGWVFFRRHFRLICKVLHTIILLVFHYFPLILLFIFFIILGAKISNFACFILSRPVKNNPDVKKMLLRDSNNDSSISQCRQESSITSSGETGNTKWWQLF